ncbi:glycosyl hydrolase family 61-domain-containing protein [Mycena floridula]|nr:glycosyl hydrolase family 61-domain-containing protein [Mycena floridula]
MKLCQTLSSILAVAITAHAHATFQDFWVGSTDMVSTCVRLPLNNNPITSVSGPDIACNTNPQASPGLCTVAAGSQVSVEMHQQPGDRTCTTEAIGGNHDGPTIIYMAKVDNALTASGTSAKWFKVAQVGLVSTDYWGTDVMNANCGKVVFTVPSCIPAGQYLIRAEVIALHVASSVGGAQFYASCYTINVTGGGAASPATVSFPGAYSATDPGILFNLYGSYTSYTIPGPPVFSCSGAGTGTPTTSTGPTTTAKPTSTVSTTSAPTTSAGSGAGAVLYGQCGGIGWTGPTSCAQGTCKATNAYYSQCLP